MHAEDYSGSIWHGSAGKFSVNALDAGALEWRLHPVALLRMTVAADLHWVKVGFVIDGAVQIDHSGFIANDVKGGGPIEDLRELGVAPGWRGLATIEIDQLQGAWTGPPSSAVADIQVANLSSATFAAGANLGGYDLQMHEGAVGPDGTATATLADTGGPLQVQAVIRLSAVQHTATLSGTLKERDDAPPALRSQLDSLSQLRGRDPQGRIPVELEFTL